MSPHHVILACSLCDLSTAQKRGETFKKETKAPISDIQATCSRFGQCSSYLGELDRFFPPMREGRESQEGWPGVERHSSGLMCHLCCSRTKAEAKPNATHEQFHFSQEAIESKRRERPQPGSCLYTRTLLREEHPCIKLSSSIFIPKNKIKSAGIFTNVNHSFAHANYAALLGCKTNLTLHFCSWWLTYFLESVFPLHKLNKKAMEKQCQQHRHHSPAMVFPAPCIWLWSCRQKDAGGNTLMEITRTILVSLINCLEGYKGTKRHLKENIAITEQQPNVQIAKRWPSNTQTFIHALYDTLFQQWDFNFPSMKLGCFSTTPEILWGWTSTALSSCDDIGGATQVFTSSTGVIGHSRDMSF